MNKTIQKQLKHDPLAIGMVSGMAMGKAGIAPAESAAESTAESKAEVASARSEGLPRLPACGVSSGVS